MTYLSMSSAHDGQDASVRNILADHRLDGFELAISEVFVHKLVAQDALGSRLDRRLFHRGIAWWSLVLEEEGDSRAGSP